MWRPAESADELSPVAPVHPRREVARRLEGREHDTTISLCHRLRKEATIRARAKRCNMLLSDQTRSALDACGLVADGLLLRYDARLELRGHTRRCDHEPRGC